MQNSGNVAGGYLNVNPPQDDPSVSVNENGVQGIWFGVSLLSPIKVELVHLSDISAEATVCSDFLLRVFTSLISNGRQLWLI